jgi:hypothetical protein
MKRLLLTTIILCVLAVSLAEASAPVELLGFTS